MLQKLTIMIEVPIVTLEKTWLGCAKRTTKNLVLILYTVWC